MADQKMFQRVNSILIEFPELHRQQYWQEGDTAINNSCGTTRCVAGWAVWLKATDLELISRKRDDVTRDVLHSVAASVGVDTEDKYGDPKDLDSLYQEVGAKLLGLDYDEAHSLFLDMSNGRVTHRVESYAATGEDISDEEYNEAACG